MADKFDWTPFKGGTGEFVKFKEIGDMVTGTIVAIRSWKQDDEEVPFIDIEPRGGGDVVTLSVDKVDLRYKLAELEPDVGDDLRVRFTGTQKVANGTKKVFEVQHRRAVPKPAHDEVPPDLAEYSDDVF